MVSWNLVFSSDNLVLPVDFWEKWPKSDHTKQQNKIPVHTKILLVNQPVGLHKLCPRFCSNYLDYTLSTPGKRTIYTFLWSHCMTLISELFMGFLDYPVDCPIFCILAISTALHGGSSDQQGFVWHLEEKTITQALAMINFNFHLDWTKKHIRYQWSKFLRVSLVCLRG